MSRKIQRHCRQLESSPFQAMVSIIPRQYKDGSFMVAMLYGWCYVSSLFSECFKTIPKQTKHPSKTQFILPQFYKTA
jgi:hypothetical protein